MSVSPRPGMSPVTAGHPRAVPAPPQVVKIWGSPNPGRVGHQGSPWVGMSPRAWGTRGTGWGDTVGMRIWGAP